MATSHQLSVLTNASVKPPRNPSTGLSSSLHERPVTISGRFSGIYYDDYDEEREERGEVLETRSRPKFASTADPAALLHLSNLSDEEFYEKLLQLKNEQRKLLQKCEQIYIEKHKGVIEPTFPLDKDDVLSSPQTEKQDRLLSPTSAEINDTMATADRSVTPALREGRITPPLSTGHSPLNLQSRKPPTGRLTHTFVAKSLPSPKWEIPERPSSAPISREHAQSLDDLRERATALRKSIEYSDEEDIFDDTVSEPYKPRDISLAMSRIEDMWDNFQIEDYAPRRSERHIRVSSATVTRKEKKAKDDNWRHRLTVPEPFNMTLRDENKEKKKTKTQIEFEELRLQKEKEAEEECVKKFKATPVPAHVYLPLFDEIMEKGEHRRRHVRAMSEEVLKSQEKPFSFLKREADKKQHQLMTRECSQERKGTEKQTFKAKPVPQYIFDRAVDDKIMEEEEYRKIRMKMRSDELLRSASLPPNMEARQKMFEQKKKEQKLKSKRKSQKTHARPRVSHQVPNYDALYRQFQEELQRRKGERESTVAHPFRLETQRVLSSREKERIRREIEKDNERFKENRWPHKMSRGKPRSLGRFSKTFSKLTFHCHLIGDFLN